MLGKQQEVVDDDDYVLNKAIKRHRLILQARVLTISPTAPFCVCSNVRKPLPMKRYKYLPLASDLLSEAAAGCLLLRHTLKSLNADFIC